ncbi:hypothetical protein ACHAW6_003194 [Cyclotella cf. meneghiniana]
MDFPGGVAKHVDAVGNHDGRVETRTSGRKYKRNVRLRGFVVTPDKNFRINRKRVGRYESYGKKDVHNHDGFVAKQNMEAKCTRSHTSDDKSRQKDHETLKHVCDLSTKLNTPNMGYMTNVTEKTRTNDRIKGFCDPVRVDSTLDPIPTNLSATFPPGAPVWFKFERVIDSNRAVLKAYEGVVMSVLRNRASGTFTYEIVRSNNAVTNSINEVFSETVKENNIAFGSGCPVYVKMLNTDSTCYEMDGKIITPNFVGVKERNVVLSYTVQLFMNDGSIQIEENVPESQIRYKFCLKQLQSKLREESNPRRMVGIRTNSRGVPMTKRYPCYGEMTPIIKPLVGPALPISNVTVSTANHHRPVAKVCNRLSEHFIFNHNVAKCLTDAGVGESKRKIIKREGSPHRKKTRNGFCYAHSVSFQHKLSKKYKSDNADKQQIVTAICNDNRIDKRVSDTPGPYVSDHAEEATEKYSVTTEFADGTFALEKKVLSAPKKNDEIAVEMSDQGDYTTLNFFGDEVPRTPVDSSGEGKTYADSLSRQSNKLVLTPAQESCSRQKRYQ